MLLACNCYKVWIPLWISKCRTQNTFYVLEKKTAPAVFCCVDKVSSAWEGGLAIVVMNIFLWKSWKVCFSWFLSVLSFIWWHFIKLLPVSLSFSSNICCPTKLKSLTCYTKWLSVTVFTSICFAFEKAVFLLRRCRLSEMC